MNEDLSQVERRVAETIAQRGLADGETPVLLMVSGGSDSTALAYIAARLHDAGVVGPLALLHVDHKLRGADSTADAEFVARVAEALGIPFFLCEVDVAAAAEASGENVEAVARRERYQAADEALESLCRQMERPVAEGRIFTAHTQNDRVENFYMRSIVGTGPGGFRSMRYANGRVMRPCLDVNRQDLRDYLEQRAKEESASPMVEDDQGCLWREDATNAHTDRFRAYVRHEIVPRAEQRNPRLLEVLCRTMNQIAEEDDLLQGAADDLIRDEVAWLQSLPDGSVDYGSGCLFQPGFATSPAALQRRAAHTVLDLITGADVRVDSSSVEAVCSAFVDGVPVSGYTGNIQGDLALSANKHGLRVEPMAAYRARRKAR